MAPSSWLQSSLVFLGAEEPVLEMMGEAAHNSSVKGATHGEMAQTVRVPDWNPTRPQKAPRKALYKMAPRRLLKKTQTPSTYNIHPVTGEPLCIGTSRTPMEDQTNLTCTESGGGKPVKQVSM